MRILAALLTAALAFGVAGCSWMGRTAGKTQAAVEDGVNDMERGYHQGYNQEKRKPRTETREEAAPLRPDPDVPTQGTAL